MLISVVIPALNEESALPAALRAYERQAAPIEVIVVDGGSADRTVEAAADRAHVLRAQKGRARQMNAGAASARGDVLWFMHADSVPTADAAGSIREAVANGADAGTFRLAFDHAGPFLRFCARCTHLPARSIAFGDRGLFMRSDVFNRIGGYADIPLFEDLDIVGRVSASADFRFMPQTVVTSARRFRRNGALKQQMLNSVLWVRYLLGDDSASLAVKYPPHDVNLNDGDATCIGST